MTESRRDDMLGGVSVMVLSSIGLLWLIPTYIVIPGGSGYDLSPASVPQISLGLCFLLGAGLFVKGRFGKAITAPDTAIVGDTDDDPDTARSASGIAFDLMIWGVSSIAVMVLLPRIGFIVTGFMLLGGWLVFAGVRRWQVIVGVAAVLPVLLDRLSWYALTVQFP